MPDPIIVRREDDLIHTSKNPFYTDPTYPDRVDPALLAEVAQQVTDGLLTALEATRTIQGRQL